MLLTTLSGGVQQRIRLTTHMAEKDCIYVLDEGMIREAGTHKELMAKLGVYAGLFDKQAHFYRADWDPQVKEAG